VSDKQERPLFSKRKAHFAKQKMYYCNIIDEIKFKGGNKDTGIFMGVLLM
jgi:hypothetical protein